MKTGSELNHFQSEPINSTANWDLAAPVHCER
jgi:hypothetical protein